MRYLLTLIALLGIMTMSGCGYKEGISTGDQKSYLYFTGNVEDIKVSVDGGEEFSVKEGRDNQYEIKPGKHMVVIYKNDDLAVKREIFVGDGIAKEIEVK